METDYSRNALLDRLARKRGTGAGIDQRRRKRAGPMTMVRGVRGAITVDRDESEAILSATERLLKAIVAENSIDTTQIASALFSATPDLTTAFPALAARRIGWTFVPLLTFAEIDVVGGLPRCVRILVHLNTDLAQDRIVHVFLEGARVLRPDLVARGQRYRKMQHM